DHCLEPAGTNWRSICTMFNVYWCRSRYCFDYRTRLKARSLNENFPSLFKGRSGGILMPTFTSNDAQINYQTSGDASKPAIVFSNSLGTKFIMWQPQI